MDCKATVKLGNLSRGGMTRGDNRACDHDMEYDGKHTPCGILEEDTGQLHIAFGSSAKTSDFIMDSLQAWWNQLSVHEQQATPQIQIKVDNGPESSGVRTQFLKRMVEWVDQIQKPVQLLYFPPYHSKYNPIERCWGILELHWNGAKLLDTQTMLAWARSMTWKGLTPIVKLSDSIYAKGISLGKKAMKDIESRLHLPAYAGHGDQRRLQARQLPKLRQGIPGAGLRGGDDEHQTQRGTSEVGHGFKPRDLTDRTEVGPTPLGALIVAIQESFASSATLTYQLRMWLGHSQTEGTIESAVPRAAFSSE